MLLEKNKFANELKSSGQVVTTIILFLMLKIILLVLKFFY